MQALKKNDYCLISVYATFRSFFSRKIDHFNNSK